MIFDSTFLRLLHHPLGKLLCYFLSCLLITQPVVWALPPDYLKINPLKLLDFLTQSAEAAETVDDDTAPPVLVVPADITIEQEINKTNNFKFYMIYIIVMQI